MQRQTIIQFGHGYMGDFHFDAVTSAVRANPKLDIVMVEPKPDRRQTAIARMEQKGIDPAGRFFETGEKALQAQHGEHPPFAAIIACNDEQHKPVLHLLREKAPNLRALFSEKPLTETLQEARQLEPWLAGLDLVTMNTVIDFSAVFPEFRRLQTPGKLLDGFKLIGAEGAWLGSYHTYHRALPIGVAGDILHPMNVVVAMLGAGPVEMQSGLGASGYLNELSPNIIHDVSSSRWRGNDNGINVFLRSCYSGDERQRTVIGYYKRDATLFAVEFNFDRLDQGFEGADTLDVYAIIPGSKPLPVYRYQARNCDVDMGYAADAQAGKAQAFVGQSLRAYFEPAYRKELTTLDDAIATQAAVSAIRFGNPALRLSQISGADNKQRISTARAKGELETIFPFGLSLAKSSARNINSRVAPHMEGSGNKLGDGFNSYRSRKKKGFDALNI